MKGRICNSCNAVSPYHEPNCRKCGKTLEYIKIEDALEYDDSGFYKSIDTESKGNFSKEMVGTKQSAPKAQLSNNSMPNDYKTTIVVSKFVSFMGWIVCAVAILLVIVSLSSAGRFGLLAIAPAIGVFIGGLILVMAGQATRATVENTNYSRQMLELMKKQ